MSDLGGSWVVIGLAGLTMVTIFAASVVVVAARRLANRMTSSQSGNSSESRTRILERESDYVTVVHEFENGYGTAVRESDGGLDVLSFNGEDEVYQVAWVSGSALDDFADVVSAFACEKEADDDE